MKLEKADIHIRTIADLFRIHQHHSTCQSALGSTRTPRTAAALLASVLIGICLALPSTAFAGLINSGFEDTPDLTGWTIAVGQHPGSATVVRGGDATHGTAFARLAFSGNCLGGAGCTEYGPTLRSASFTATGGEVISFDWRATNSGDWWAARGFLVDTSTDLAVATLFDNVGTGSDTTWATATVTVPAAGSYRLEFQVGSFDASFGLFIGAQLDLDGSSCPISGGADTDGDGAPDACDNCLNDPNPGQEDTCPASPEGDACDVDTDSDGAFDSCDNCPDDSNPGQEDTDGSGIGDLCNDTDDADGDEFEDGFDNCPSGANPGQEDGDGDGFGDVCDSCVGPGPDDVDADGVCSLADNCPDDANPGQEDLNGDEIGDVCQPQGVLDTAGCYAAFDTVAPPDGSEPTFAFNDISGSGMALPLGDDQVSSALPLGFNFEFYGTTYSDAYVSSNGFMTFLPGQSNGCCSGQSIPSGSSPNGYVAGLWKDLYPPNGAIYYQTVGTAPNRQFIVQFEAVPEYPGSSFFSTWEIILNETTNEVLVQYVDGQSGGDVTTAGIENANGTVGLRWGGPSSMTLSNQAVVYSPTTGLTDDTDSDGVRDCLDNCPIDANPGQEDTDSDGVGDACDCGDGILATIEACDDGNTDAGDGCDATCETESGYECAVPGDPCTDLDECTLGTDNCDTNATCTNEVGSFSCACNSGWQGSGVVCTDIDECDLETDDCDANATCTNEPGTFSCACNSGWQGSGVTCTDIDECTLGTDNCDVNAGCINAPGTFACLCNPGFQGTGVECDLPHFVSYKIRVPRKDVAGDAIDNKLPRKWVITVNDVHLDDGDPDDPENFDVKRAKSLLVPAQKNLEPAPVFDGLHYLRYQMKSARESIAPAVGGDFVRPPKHVKRIWQLENQLGTINVESKKVSALLLPANKDLDSSPVPPADANHFVCYQVKATKDLTDQTPESRPGSGRGKFRKDLQAYFEDQLDDCAFDKEGNPSFPGSSAAGKCLFDLKKVKELCNPMDKTAVQPPRETSASITPSIATTPRSLLCYQARLARKFTNSDTASLANAVVGDKVEPGQAKHTKRGVKTGNPIHTAPGNLFPNPVLVDTSNHELVCIPTDVTSVVPVAP